MAAIVRHNIVQAAGGIALRFRVFAQPDQQAANFRYMMTLQCRERENVVAFIPISQRSAGAKVRLESFIGPGE